ncbi:hypothetical protein AKJ16_DCAP04467 [Drosera capensis]
MAVAVMGWSSTICEVSILLPKNGTIVVVVVGSVARGLIPVCRILFTHPRLSLCCSSLHYYNSLLCLVSGLHFQSLGWLDYRLLCQS